MTTSPAHDNPVESILCLGCRYDLRGLPKGNCPECGRPFDPDDATTYASAADCASPRRIIAIIVASLAWPMLQIIMNYAAYIRGRIELGRWPITSIDDPKGMSGETESLALLALACFGCSVYLGPIILGLVICWSISAWRRGDVDGALYVGASVLAGWLLLGAWIIFMQGHILSWMVD